jgi:hypothetical protein
LGSTEWTDGRQDFLQRLLALKALPAYSDEFWK